MTVVNAIRERAAATSDTVPLSDVTHRERDGRALAADVQGLSEAIRQAGIGRADRVALALPNGMEAAIGFLGASTAAVAAPLNPGLTKKEFSFLLSDLEARLLVVAGPEPAAAREAAADLDVPVMTMTLGVTGGIETMLDITPRRNAATATEPRDDDVALVLHTSGTTARPKLVPLTHRNLEFSARNIGRFFELGPADRCLVLMPLFHIHGIVACLLAPILAGGGTVCTPGYDATRIEAWLREVDPTWFSAVPSIHHSIVTTMRRADRENPTGSLRFIRSCSSALPPVLYRDLREVFAVPVVESYGMTEMSHQIASNPLPPGQPKIGSVGMASGTRIAVLDDSDRELPAGTEGEVAVRGDGLMAGYHANPEATDAAFTNGWFRTGDSGVLDSDGYLYLNGRIKELVNRGGEKISPREIEEAVLEFPGVSEAVAYPVPHALLGEEVGLAIVTREAQAVALPELQRFLRGRLAYFKVPRHICVLDRLPTGPTGKIRRRFVAAELADRGISPEVVVETRAPASGLETDLARMVETVLDDQQAVGATHDFLALGVDSLKAGQIIARIAQDYGTELSLLEFFELATVEQVALALTLRAAQQKSAEEICALLKELPTGGD